MAHEDMLTKLDAAFQTGDAPDVYMERGGGELASHVEAALVQDTSEVASEEIEKIGPSVGGWQVDGKTYALPFSVGVVGFWYNKALALHHHRRRPGDTHQWRKHDTQADTRGQVQLWAVDRRLAGAGPLW